MKKIILLRVATFMVIPMIASEQPINASMILFTVGKEGKTITMEQLSRISIRDFQRLTGKKLKLPARIGFKLMQKKLRDNIKAC